MIATTTRGADTVRAAETPLTRDNPHLSGPTIRVSEVDPNALAALQEGPDAVRKFAIDCTNELRRCVESYVEAGIAPATRRAYRADLDHFRAWGGKHPGDGRSGGRLHRRARDDAEGRHAHEAACGDLRCPRRAGLAEPRAFALDPGHHSRHSTRARKRAASSEASIARGFVRRAGRHGRRHEGRSGPRAVAARLRGRV